MTTDEQAINELTEAAKVLAATTDIGLRGLGQRVLNDLRYTTARKPKPEQTTDQPSDSK